MDYRFVFYQSAIYIVLGIGYDGKYDPPDVFILVPLETDIFKSIITNLEPIIVPFTEVTEITEESVLQAIWVLYGN